MPPARPAPERFAEKCELDPETGCLMWTGYCNAKGYGIFTPSHGVKVLAYRWAWEQVNGPVPDGLVLDHVVCDRPGCANHEHVTPTTQRANILRSGATIAGRNARKTHCAKGHAYDEANTIHLKRGGRRCRACHNQRSRA